METTAKLLSVLSEKHLLKGFLFPTSPTFCQQGSVAKESVEALDLPQ